MIWHAAEAKRKARHVIQQTLTSQQAFERYEAVKGRFPVLPFGPQEPKVAANLGDLSDHYDIFVFDAFGVLNVGESPIAGACERMAALRSAGKSLFVLTNAASYCFAQVEQKFKRLGFDFEPGELVSSRAVCEQEMAGLDPSILWGVIAPKAFDQGELAFKTSVLGDDPTDYEKVDAFLFLSSECWTRPRQRLLVEALQARLRPVIVANPDLVAPRENGLTLEPGYFAHDLIDQVPGLSLVFHGKPFASVYDEIERRVGKDVSRDRIVMMGDSLHTDIWGARVRGWGSVLVTDHGFLRGQDVLASISQSEIYPDWIVGSI
ncbi:HAD hydrolase-like protein [uncultured Cohaesibacter sp.]|uniref:HAD-IIA family hydrolase n=1 Tax=uncultured Cohaesibacter sp. TaxID=1002546 RepID=UPI002931DD1C|nr:HAD hydrolase-like protein [uncultured Cohaesibacter sp.]